MERSKSIEHCGKVLAAVKIVQAGYEGKVSTAAIAHLSGLTEKQVQAAIETMTRGRHPQVEGDCSGVTRINDIRHTY